MHWWLFCNNLLQIVHRKINIKLSVYFVNFSFHLTGFGTKMSDEVLLQQLCGMHHCFASTQTALVDLRINYG